MKTIGVLLDGPLAGRYAYRPVADAPARAGDWIVVPWGKSRRVGLVVDDGIPEQDAQLDPQRIRDAEQLLADMPSVDAAWLGFIGFAASYYHASMAELALGSIPKLLRSAPTARTRKGAAMRLAELASPLTAGAPTTQAPEPSAAQAAILDALQLPPGPDSARPWLLHGVTGSGKTEIYLRWLASRLAGAVERQVLLLVPEIGLTPALVNQLERRFPNETVAVLHSDMTDASRASHWLAAASGQARIVVGTRMAVLVPLPHLAGIVVDEEHDPSYKQQEGVRYSARDMAVARAARSRCPILLGSATPSIESWRHARSGHYRLLSLTERVRGGELPGVRLVPLRGAKLQHGLTDSACSAIRATLERGEQALVFLNRRGYAPVLSCQACGWLSDCDHCDAWRVLHRLEARPPSADGTRPAFRLVCHHCGSERPVPRACPTCGNQDLEPLGRGTQKLEEGLTSLFPEARIGRLDRDVARRRGGTERFLAAAHGGETNLLVGTQMLAKGHDFEKLSLVVAVDADSGLFAADFRAPERLFATLMQVAGRGGRHTARQAQTLIQTRFPEHPLFGRLLAHDYPGFADEELKLRADGQLPPYSFQALLLAEAKSIELVLGFLESVSAHFHEQKDSEGVTVCDPIPMPLARLKSRARGQMLVESSRRAPLHQALERIRPTLAQHAAEIRGGLRWQIVIDPAEI